LKDSELKLVAELMKNSRRSDRELARTLKTSQPTVTRTRTKLEKQGYIREYTVIPDFVKLGFQLASFILVKLRKDLTPEQLKQAQKISLKDMNEKAPDEIVLFNRGIGGQYSGILVSFHKNYSDYTKLLQRIRQYPFVDTSATIDFIVDLNDQIQYRYFTLATLAKHLISTTQWPQTWTAPKNKHPYNQITYSTS